MLRRTFRSPSRDLTIPQCVADGQGFCDHPRNTMPIGEGEKKSRVM